MNSSFIKGEVSFSKENIEKRLYPLENEIKALAMDASTAKWFSEMGMEDSSLLYQCEMDFLHDPIPQFTPNHTPQITNPNFPCFNFTPTTSNSVDLDSDISQPIIETRQWDSNVSQNLGPKPSSPPFSSIISFGNEQELTKDSRGNIVNTSVTSEQKPSSPTKVKYDNGSVGRVNMVKSSLQAKDQVIAERKRREKLNEGFIALSALLPSLTKLDKASILEGATQHIKELHENVKVLEEETMSKRNSGTVRVIIPCVLGNGDTSSSVDNFDDKPNVEVEVRVWDSEVLIRMFCENGNGIMGKIFCEIEKLNMIVIDSNVMLFGHNSLAISIVSQMEGQLSSSAKDLANRLGAALGN